MPDVRSKPRRRRSLTAGSVTTPSPPSSCHSPKEEERSRAATSWVLFLAVLVRCSGLSPRHRAFAISLGPQHSPAATRLLLLAPREMLSSMAVGRGRPVLAAMMIENPMSSGEIIRRGIRLSKRGGLSTKEGRERPYSDVRRLWWNGWPIPVHTYIIISSARV